MKKELNLTAEQSKKTVALLVVAGALIDADGNILLQQRPAGSDHAGLWEFPGGKVEGGETAAQALGRELCEEIAIKVDPAAISELGFADEPLGPRNLILLLYACRRWKGTPAPLQAGAQLSWCAPKSLLDLPMPPADRKLRGVLLRFLATAV